MLGAGCSPGRWPTRKPNLGALLTCYCERLTKRGSASGSKVRALFRRHIEVPFPRLWVSRARTIQSADLMAPIDRLVEQEKLPTARKLRAALHAAFEVAIQSPRCARSAEFRRFRIAVNPVSQIRSVESDRPLPERVLSVAELRALWGYLSEMRCVRGPVLRFYLLTGAQRLEQLLRAMRDDLMEEGLVLWDKKGRRQRPRRHVVPLIAPARLALMAMGRSGPHVVSTDRGRSGLHPSTIWRYVAGVSDALLKEGLIQSSVSPSDLRRTVETRLAALGVSPAVRAQLQSHGLEGVQARHYDRYGYLEEKRQALERFYALVSASV